MLVPLGGTKHGGYKATETSVIEFCYVNEKLLVQSSKTLKLILLPEQELLS